MYVLSRKQSNADDLCSFMERYVNFILSYNIFIELNAMTTPCHNVTTLVLGTEN